MTFEVFCKELIKVVSARTGADVRIKEIVKNNDTILHGLIIKGESNVAPTIYVDDMYEADANIEAVADQIMSTLSSIRPMDFDTNSILDFDKVKEKIVPKLINRDMNQTLLGTVVHQSFLDLEVIYQIKVFSNGNETGTVTIKNEFLENWGSITVEELHRVAIKNLSKEKFMSMGEMLGFPEAPGMPSLYVLTTQDGNNGAAIILKSGIIKGIADQLDKNLQLIPSSIHEWLITDADYDGIKGIIESVNTEVVNETEILSDHPYFYDRETGVISW